MKTKTLFIKLLLTVLLMIVFFSCDKCGVPNLLSMLMIAFFFCKNSSPSNKNQNNKPGALNGTWVSTTWRDVNGNIIEFAGGSDVINGTISQSFSSTLVYSFGKVTSTEFPSAVVSTYKNFRGDCYASGWQTVNTGNVVLTLKNGNTKFIVDYPGISEGVLWTGNHFRKLFMNIKNNKILKK